MRNLVIGKIDDYLYSVIDQEKGQVVLAISTTEPLGKPPWFADDQTLCLLIKAE